MLDKELSIVSVDAFELPLHAPRATDADGVVVYGSGNSIGPMEPQAIVVTEPTTSTNGTFLNPTHAYLHETLSMNSAFMAGGYGLYRKDLMYNDFISIDKIRR